MSDTQAVLEKLLQDHVGKENGITQGQLAEALGLKPSTARSELRRLREERNIPIGNLRNGYFIIEDKEGLQDYIGHINSEIESKKKTIEHTVEAFESFDGNIPESRSTTTQEPTYECGECGDSVTKSDVKYPESSNEPHCKHCFGQKVIRGEA